MTNDPVTAEYFENRNHPKRFFVSLFFCLLSTFFIFTLFKAPEKELPTSRIFHVPGQTVLMVQNCENSSSAYRGNQLQLLQNILRSIRFSQISVSRDVAEPTIAAAGMEEISRNTAIDFDRIQNIPLKIYLTLSFPVRAGPLFS